MSRETLTIITLIGMPVLAASCLGMLVRSLVGGGRSWVLWLLVLAALCATWLYVFTGTT